MADVEFKIQGLSQLNARLDAVARQFGDAIGPALRAEAEIEMTEAKRRTPVRTGALRGSGNVQGPRRNWRDVEVVLAFGGPAAPYAVYVHENLEALHPRGGQAKFLESTIVESMPYLAQRVARRIRSAIGA